MQQAPKLSVVLVSPQLSKLHAAAVLASTAAASGMTVNVFATMDAMGQFRRQTLEERAFVVDEVGRALLERGVPLFDALLRQGKELGELHVFGCALAADVMGWKPGDFVDLIEDVIGVSAFFARSEGAQILTI